MSDNDGKAGGTGRPPTCRSGESDDKYATFSNFAVSAADQKHTIAAPGVCIRSDWYNGGDNTISGTSMAAPHVAGAVALCINSGGVGGPCATLAPADIITQMRTDAQMRTAAENGPADYGFVGDPSQPVDDRYYGYLVSGGSY